MQINDEIAKAKSNLCLCKRLRRNEQARLIKSTQQGTAVPEIVGGAA